MTLTYDQQRDARIRENKELLASLGLEKPLIEPKATKAPSKKAAAASKKRKVPPPEDDEDDMVTTKAARVVEDASSADGPRRSSRTAGKKVDYTGEQDRSLPESLHAKARREADPELGPVGREDGKRVHDP